MAWTYTDTPATVPRDAVRLAIGDTDSADPQPVSDAEIAYFLTESNADVPAAAAMAADKLAAYYARQADTSNGSLSIGASARSAAFAKLAARIRARRGAASGASMFAGGLSISGKENLASDADAVQPFFRIGMDDLPGSYSPDDSETIRETQ